MIRNRKSNGLVVAAAVTIMAATATAQDALAVKRDETRSETTHISVRTRQGLVRGVWKAGVLEFLGIPYAAPPVDELRWRPPAPPANHGPIDATRYRETCPQSNELAVFTGPPSVTEDCLYLNVFTTGVRSNGKPKPVLLWIHGGGNTTGSANDYDGSKLAKGGPYGSPTVVVTLNYRLGLLGFLAHPALMKQGEPFANYGTMDQQAALRWIKANIESFGGDPSRVAVGGQSGGSVDVHANVISPLAAGLFNRAIFQSAPFAIFVPLPQARERAVAFAEAAGCPGADDVAATCLRQLTVPRILQLQGTIKDNGPYLDPGNQNVIVDGTIIPMQPLEAYGSGKFNKMPVLGGTTTDELTFVMGMQEYFSGPPPGSPLTFASTPPQRAMTAEDLNSRIRAGYGPAATAILERYPVEKYGDDPFETYNRILADPIQCVANLEPLKVFARQVPTYGYVFAYQGAPFYLPKMPGYRALAAHTIDIQFLFTGYHGGPLGVNLDQGTGMPRELNVEETRLSDQLIGFWTNFAASGNPNGSGAEVWPAFTAERPLLLRQDIPLSVMDEPTLKAKFDCDFWLQMQPH